MPKAPTQPEPEAVGDEDIRDGGPQSGPRRDPRRTCIVTRQVRSEHELIRFVLDPQGRVRFEYDNCVGCAGCIDGCPYGVIRLVEAKPLPPPKPTFLQSLPLLGKLFGEPEQPPAPATAAEGEDVKPRSVGAGGKVSPVNGKTIKCDLCAGLPFEACVYNCPTEAIKRKEPQSLFDRRRGL